MHSKNPRLCSLKHNSTINNVCNRGGDVRKLVFAVYDQVIPKQVCSPTSLKIKILLVLSLPRAKIIKELIRLHGCPVWSAPCCSQTPKTGYLTLSPIFTYLTLIPPQFLVLKMSSAFNCLLHIFECICLFVCLFVCLLLYVPSQQLWSLRDGQFT